MRRDGAVSESSMGRMCTTMSKYFHLGGKDCTCRSSPGRYPWSRRVRVGDFLYLSCIMICAIPAIEAADPPLGPGDTIDIQVFQEPDLSLQLVISEDGQIRYPLLDTLNVTGMTAFGLAGEIELLLTDGGYLRTASVQIAILDRKSSLATLSGTVHSPGTFPLDPGERLREFLSKHGGIRDQEASPYIVVSHVNGATTTISRRGLFFPRSDDDSKLNIPLRHQDDVIVPGAEMFYVQGAVMLPRGFFLTEELTLREAIGLAGGWNEESGTEIIWQRPAAEGRPSMILSIPISELESGDPAADALVGPGDTIYVEQFNSFYVSGAVNKPGGYLWRDGLTLSEAVIVAGDLSGVGSKKVRLRRKSVAPDEEPTKHNLSAIKKGREQDPVIWPGDVIIVNQNWLALPLGIREIFPFVGSAGLSYSLN